MRDVLIHIRNVIYAKLITFRLKENHYLCNRGIGDTLIFLSRLKEYKNECDKSVNLILPENQISLVNGYREYINKILVLPTNKIIRLIDAVVNKKMDKITFILPTGALKKLENGLSIYDLVGETLNLNSREYRCPEFQVSDDRITKIKKELGITGREYAIIAPDAMSVNSIPDDVWKTVVEECRKRNYVILENAASQNSVKYGDINIFLPLDEMFMIAKDASVIYSIRSGLSDLLSFTKTPMTVFYPNEYFLKLYSFKNMPFSEHVKEIVFVNEEKIIC